MDTTCGEAIRASLLRRGIALERVTLAWNVIGVAVLVASNCQMLWMRG
jgi:hypothetical protein